MAHKSPVPWGLNAPKLLPVVPAPSPSHGAPPKAACKAPPAKMLPLLDDDPAMLAAAREAALADTPGPDAGAGSESSGPPLPPPPPTVTQSIPPLPPPESTKLQMLDLQDIVATMMHDMCDNNNNVVVEDQSGQWCSMPSAAFEECLTDTMASTTASPAGAAGVSATAPGPGEPSTSGGSEPRDPANRVVAPQPPALQTAGGPEPQPPQPVSPDSEPRDPANPAIAPQQPPALQTAGGPEPQPPQPPPGLQNAQVPTPGSGEPIQPAILGAVPYEPPTPVQANPVQANPMIQNTTASPAGAAGVSATALVPWTPQPFTSYTMEDVADLMAWLAGVSTMDGQWRNVLNNHTTNRSQETRTVGRWVTNDAGQRGYVFENIGGPIIESIQANSAVRRLASGAWEIRFTFPHSYKAGDGIELNLTTIVAGEGGEESSDEQGMPARPRAPPPAPPRPGHPMIYY